MNTAGTHESIKAQSENAPIPLSLLRSQKGYSIEYVANKLHLRVCIIELLENADFDSLPEPVFVKGYLRAYAKLLGVSPDPFLAQFNNQYDFEKKPERTLWQSRRQTPKADHVIRWFTLAFALAVMLAVGLWWQKNQDTQPDATREESSALSLKENQFTTGLTDISKVEALVNPESQMSLMGKKDA